MKTIILTNRDKNSQNCVFYVREKVKNLPWGLTTLNDKIKIIDSKNAKIGRVAIIQTGQQWGHVAIVREVKDDQITIEEANFVRNKITIRTGTKEELKIVGFFNPQKKKWNKNK